MKLKFPVLFINFKTYPEASGKNAVLLAKKAEAVSRKTGALIVLAVQATDLRLVSSAVKLPVFAQHVDTICFGGCTGHILPAAVKEAGAVGTVLNHAENKRTNRFLDGAIKRAKKSGLMVLACAETTARAKEIASFPIKPDFIAVEPPELIGGKISVSKAKPELVRGSTAAVKSCCPSIKVITGAGIKSKADVKKAIELGTSGVFVSSGIIKAKNQRKAIEEMVKGFF